MGWAVTIQSLRYPLMTNPIRLVVSIDQQRLDVVSGDELLRSFTISTETKGVGFAEGCYRTPTGRFRVAKKIGDGEPVNTIFKGRVPIGVWDGMDQGKDYVLTRILQLDGLDTENANTLDRYVYIHGTNREAEIGVPTSHGCFCLTNRDMLELFDLVPEGTEIVVTPPREKKGKLIFFDCDCTLASIEGIDELARYAGNEVFDKVSALTNAAMNGEVPLDQVFSNRMDIIRPDRSVCDAVSQQYLKNVTPGAKDLVALLKQNGWMPVILSGGFAPLIRPLATELGIDHVEAVPLYLNEDGSYRGYGEDYPTTRNLGKNQIIREWKAAMLPEKVVMVGDGISDLETTPDVDLFIGYGGAVARPGVRQASDHWLTNMTDHASIFSMLGESGTDV